MSHKTKIKAGGSTPPSVAELFRKHSKTRVLVASKKRFMVNPATPFSMPTFSRELTDELALESVIKQYT